MNALKLKELIDNTALDNLLNPDACVVTYSHNAGLELCCTRNQMLGAEASSYADFMLNDLYLHYNGKWYSRKSAHIILISKDIKLDREIAMLYENFIKFYKEKEQPISQIIDSIINKAKGLDWGDTITSPVNPKYAIHNKFFIDSQIFDTMAEAKDHHKTIEIFDAFIDGASVTNYQDYKTVIEDMVKNPKKYIKILQGV